MKEKLKKISDVVWEMPQDYKEGMQVPGRFYGTDYIIDSLEENVFNQLANVACLPGIQKYAFCMPDAHSGYGFPIGGVAAFDPNNNGIISPGGIGFDINCGVRLLKTNLNSTQVKQNINKIMTALFATVPSGIGSMSKINADSNTFREIVERGVRWCVDNGYAKESDLDKIEEHGSMKGADSTKISQRAFKRGKSQLNTLGSGNHYLEVQVIDKIYDEEIATKFGIENKDQVMIMVHCGSRGYGHQIASDYLKVFDNLGEKYNIPVNDRELVAAPFYSTEGQDYFKAMICAVNYAFVNRQLITFMIRNAFQKIFSNAEIEIIYDVAHNIAKIEKHVVDGIEKELIVHRKGATRCFGPNRMTTNKSFENIGQPVLIGGSMQTRSYLLVGTDDAEETFGSTMHGSGRRMSRTQARHTVKGIDIKKEMEANGITIKTASLKGLAEEAGIAYKNVNKVVETMHLAGISKKVASFKPIGNIKG